jgi:hypothetical protein
MQNPKLRLIWQALLSFLPLLAGVLVAWVIVSDCERRASD